MDDATLVKAREQVQRALGLAKLANDPDLKQQWLALADGWSALIAAIERQPTTAKPDSRPATSQRNGAPSRS
jgi:hypothetical protein